jgi:transcriptional regulator with XRE-family HTH domain
MHLREYMAEKGLKDEDVAGAIGVDRATVVRYRHGTLTPRLKMMQRISRWSNGKIPLESWLEAAE